MAHLYKCLDYVNGVFVEQHIDVHVDQSSVITSKYCINFTGVKSAGLFAQL